MEIPLTVKSAVYSEYTDGLVIIVFNDNTTISIYLDDGSPRIYAHDLLDAWLADGNEIEVPA